jgi:hypothetical protein
MGKTHKRYIISVKRYHPCEFTRVGDKVAVSKHGPLRLAGRAGSINNGAIIIFMQLVINQGVLRHSRHFGKFQLQGLFTANFRGRFRKVNFLPDKHQLQIGILDYIDYFPRRKLEIERYNDPTRTNHCQIGNCKIRAVFAQKTHSVTLSQAFSL